MSNVGLAFARPRAANIAKKNKLYLAKRYWHGKKLATIQQRTKSLVMTKKLV
jgi:hypothetical protein